MTRYVLAAALVSIFVGLPASTTLAAPPPLRVENPPPAEATSAAGANVSYNVKAFDPDSSNPISAACNPGGSGSGDFDVTAQYPIGSTPVTCTATLENGDTVASSITVTVQDTTPPSVAAPAPITASTSEPAGTAVTWPAVGASDIVDGSLPATCSPPSGSTFALGTTTVTCSATDAHGNTGSASFTVTVTFNDTTPPTFTPDPPPNISQQTSDPGGAVVTYSVSAGDDSGTPPTVSCAPSSGSTFAVGTTTVNCTAEDTAHNTATASFTVTVVFVDTTPPTFSGVPPNSTVEANGPAGSVVNYSTPTATDAVEGPIAVVTCNPSSGSTFPLGTTSVTCSAADSNGNTGTASFSVSVVDRTKPSLVVPNDRPVYADTPDGISRQSHYVALFLSEAKAVDSVDPQPSVGNDAPEFFSVGAHVVTFSATDASGNSASKTAVLDVRPMPPSGTSPLPVPPPRRPPPDVRGLKAEAGDARVRLSWQIPNGVDHVVVSRSLTAGGDDKVVYSGSAQSFTDRSVANGLGYRYLIVSVDRNGDMSAGVAAVALPMRSLLKSPKDGARLRKPPKLVWAKNSEATYYNVQLFRGNVKILSKWPLDTAFLLQKKWKYQTRTYTLTPGVYRWYVWPGFGARAAVDYGEMLGFSSFQIVR
jgi:hypothetical protein